MNSKEKPGRSRLVYVSTEGQYEQLRDQVLDAMVTNILFQQLIDSYGLTVSDDEIREIILGDNPPDFLKQNFVDSLVEFRYSFMKKLYLIQQKIEPLVQAEEYVRQSRLTSKLQSLNCFRYSW